VGQSRKERVLRAVVPEPWGVPLRRPVLLAVAALLLLNSASGAVEASFQAKCIGVSDGDTITVLRDSNSIKVRLFGIDCPESGDDFASKAKQFTSRLVFGKTITITPVDVDRYGRTVARVSSEGTDVSVALVSAGLAWHYKEYSSDLDLASAEELARKAQAGVWSLPNPIPPWEARALRGQGGEHGSYREADIYQGNVKSRVFHAPWCRNFGCQNCTLEFHTRQEAIDAGFRPGGCCKP